MQLPSNAPFVMSGKRYLLDTNALVALMAGNAGLLSLIKQADWLGVSVINVIEFLLIYWLINIIKQSTIIIPFIIIIFLSIFKILKVFRNQIKKFIKMFVYIIF